MKALKFSTDCLLQDLAREASGREKRSRTDGDGAANCAFVGLHDRLYKLLPLLIATQIGHHVEALHGRFAINMVDGVVRIANLPAVHVRAFATAGHASHVSVSRR